MGVVHSMGKSPVPTPFESMVTYTMRNDVQNDGHVVVSSSIKT